MLRRPLSLLALVLPAAGLTTLVLAQTPPPAATPAKPAGRITIRNSPAGTAVYDDRQSIARMTKEVRVTQEGEDFILYADDLTYNKAKNQAVATGAIRVETRDSTLRGQKLFADFDAKTIVITDAVTINSHGEKDGIAGSTAKGFKAELKHKPSKLACKRVDWDYENRQGVVTGDIKMTQAKNTGTCDRIIFDEAQNVARLEGNVVFSDDCSRVMHSPVLTVFIDEDRVQTDKRTTIEFTDCPPTGTSPTPKPTKAPAYTFPKPETISPDQLSQFDVKPPPAPTPRPEPADDAKP